VKDRITLTVLEIADLAEFAGLSVTRPDDIADCMAEITIAEHSDPDGDSGLFAYFSEHPEEGSVPLGIITVTE